MNKKTGIVIVVVVVLALCAVIVVYGPNFIESVMRMHGMR
jgi:hypothetical protein